MRNAILIAGLLLLGCTSMQVATPGRALVTGREKSAVFLAALQSAQDSGLAVQSSDQVTGYIYATKGASRLTANQGASLSLSVLVTEEAGAVALDLKSILTGQMSAYGATKAVMTDFCKAFLARVPEAQVTVDGLPYKP